MHERGERVGTGLGGTKHVVVGLFLQPLGREQLIALSASGPTPELMIARFRDAGRNDVEMVRHEAIRWNDDGVAKSASVRKRAKTSMEIGREPAGLALMNCHRPMDEHAADVGGIRKPRKVSTVSVRHAAKEPRFRLRLKRGYEECAPNAAVTQIGE